MSKWRLEIKKEGETWWAILMGEKGPVSRFQIPEGEEDTIAHWIEELQKRIVSPAEAESLGPERILLTFFVVTPNKRLITGMFTVLEVGEKVYVLGKELLFSAKKRKGWARKLRSRLWGRHMDGMAFYIREDELKVRLFKMKVLGLIREGGRNE